MAVATRSQPASRLVLRKKTVERALSYLALAFFMFIALFPIFWMVMTSIKNDYDLVDPNLTPLWFQRPLTLGHYEYLFTATTFGTWLGNTLLISACVVAITRAACLHGSQALARLRCLGAGHLGLGRSDTQIIPPFLV